MLLLQHFTLQSNDKGEGMNEQIETQGGSGLPLVVSPELSN
jgi:hypothetical protein